MVQEAITEARPIPRVAEEMPVWDRIKQPLFYGILLAWAVISVLPFWLTVVYSFMPKELIYAPPRLWPQPFTLENYQAFLTAFKDFPLWLKNSTFVAAVVTPLRVLLCAMAGYAFARMEFPAKNLLFLLAIGSMMIPGQVTLVPNYWLIVRVFKLVDTLWAVIVPGLATAFGVFMMTQFFKGIPKELEEAALIDGASRFTIFFRIVLPLSKPALLALGLLTFQGEWNAFMWPLIVLQTPQNFTLPLGLAMFRFEYYSLYSYVLAGSLFNSLPIILLFFIFQRYFVEGVTFTGLKGV